MMKDRKFVGRSGLAVILDRSESTVYNLCKAGKIRPVFIIGNRPIYSVEDAKAFRAARDAAVAAIGAK